LFRPPGSARVRGIGAAGSPDTPRAVRLGRSAGRIRTLTHATRPAFRFRRHQPSSRLPFAVTISQGAACGVGAVDKPFLIRLLYEAIIDQAPAEMQHVD